MHDSVLPCYNDTTASGTPATTVRDLDEWRTPATVELVDAILALPDRADAERFLRDLLTLNEIHDLAQRWQVVLLLADGLHYAEISARTGASTATITRIASWLKHGTGGYQAALARVSKGRESSARGRPG
jgi:TrpR-related protein YerC/YecD